jgi:hypothetical protein
MATSTAKCSTARAVSVSSPKATATRTLGTSAPSGSGYRNLEECQKVQHEGQPGLQGPPGNPWPVTRYIVPTRRRVESALTSCPCAVAMAAREPLMRCHVGRGARRREE